MLYTLRQFWGGKYNGKLYPPDDYDRDVLRLYQSTSRMFDVKTYEYKRVRPQEVPSRMIYKGKNITDWCIADSPSNLYIFSKKFKAIIEEFEPGVHNFIPVQIVRPDGSEVDGEYYFFNMLQEAFTIDVERSPRAHWREYGEGFIADINPRPSLPGPALVHFSEKVGGMHIWQERLPPTGQMPPRYSLSMSGYTVSEQLMQRMKQEKIYNYQIVARGVLDTEWEEMKRDPNFQSVQHSNPLQNSQITA